MSWRQDLRRVLFAGKQLVGASFRGVPFFVDTSERGGGRRVVVHEFPLRDDPFAEDLGRKGRTFRVEGYVLGDDYLTQRDKLLAALEDQGGPGELVHPYHGVRVAVCLTVSVRESRAEGGYAAFAIEFHETPAQAPMPTETVSLSDRVATSADAADAGADAELVEKYNPTGPEYSFVSAETALKNAGAKMKSALAPIVSGTQEAAMMNGQIALMIAQASSLVRTPATILGNARAVLSALTNTIANAPGALMNTLLAAYSFDAGPIAVGTTPTRTREIANQAALTAGLRRAFAVAAARLAPVVPYVSMGDAIAARDQITAILDEQAGIAGDTAYPALVDLRAHVQQAVPGSSVFASIVTVTRAVAIPSLLLAYQLYGAVDLELDIVARNHIQHPGFVVGNLKVLSANGG